MAPPGSDWHRIIGETWGPDGRFGIVPISGGRVTWYAAARRFRNGGGLDEVAERFCRWHHPIPELIAATDPANVWSDVFDDLLPRRRWVNDRVALLGDAAHPMTPDLGQGACQAILDAWVLGEELAATSDVPSALRALRASAQVAGRDGDDVRSRGNRRDPSGEPASCGSQEPARVAGTGIGGAPRSSTSSHAARDSSPSRLGPTSSVVGALLCSWRLVRHRALSTVLIVLILALAGGATDGRRGRGSSH